MTRITFERPSLQGAICIFDFSDELEIDWPGIERFGKRVEADYSERREFPPIKELQELKEKHPKAVIPLNFGQRLRLKNPETKMAVNLQVQGFSVNQLDPHADWISFRKNIETVLNHYWDEFGTNSIDGITLRYINKLVMPDAPTYYDEFINAHPSLPVGKRDMGWIDWNQQVTIYHEDLECFFRIQSRSSPIEKEDEEPTTVVLDLSLIRTPSGGIDFSDILPWLEKAHSELKGTFLDSLTDLSRASVGLISQEESHE